MIYYYNSFENGKRYVVKYDENISGEVRYCKTGMSERYFLYHNSGSIGAIYKNLDEAVKGWGEYKTYDIILPDGTITTPAKYFNKNINDVFIPYSILRGELWPGEY